MSDQQFANNRLQNIAYATHHLLTRFQKLADQMFYEVSQKRRESDKNPGANAFFVHNEHISKFDDCPKQLKDLYQPPRYFDYTDYGHEKSAKTVESLFNQSDIS